MEFGKYVENMKNMVKRFKKLSATKMYTDSFKS